MESNKKVFKVKVTTTEVREDLMELLADSPDAVEKYFEDIASEKYNNVEHISGGGCGMATNYNTQGKLISRSITRTIEQ